MLFVTFRYMSANIKDDRTAGCEMICEYYFNLKASACAYASITNEKNVSSC